MKKWTMSGHALPNIIVYADTFDEALEKARKINPYYSGGAISQRYFVKVGEQIAECYTLSDANKVNMSNIEFGLDSTVIIE